MQTTRLPYDIHNLIIDHLSDDLPSLLTASLVCHLWVHPSRRRLLSLPNQFIHIRAGKHWEFLDLFTSTSPECTIRAHLIRNLNFEFNERIYPSILPHLPTLPNVTTLRLTYTRANANARGGALAGFPFLNRHLTSFAPIPFPNVTSLQLVRGIFPSASEAFNFAGQFPHLTSLGLYSCALNHPEEKEKEKFWRLRTNPTTTTTDISTRALSAPPPSLHTLIVIDSTWSGSDNTGLTSYLLHHPQGSQITLRHVEMVEQRYFAGRVGQMLHVLRTNTLNSRWKVRELRLGLNWYQNLGDLTMLEWVGKLTIEVGWSMILRSMEVGSSNLGNGNGAGAGAGNTNTISLIGVLKSFATKQLKTLALVVDDDMNRGVSRHAWEHNYELGSSWVWEELCEYVTSSGMFPSLTEVRVLFCMSLGRLLVGPTHILNLVKEVEEILTGRLVGCGVVVKSRVYDRDGVLAL